MAAHASTAGVAIISGAGQRLGQPEAEPGKSRLDLAQHFERRSHHLRPDAVAGQYGDVEAVVDEHSNALVVS
jgi:hypothetical protein